MSSFRQIGLVLVSLSLGLESSLSRLRQGRNLENRAFPRPGSMGFISCNMGKKSRCSTMSNTKGPRLQYGPAVSWPCHISSPTSPPCICGICAWLGKPSSPFVFAEHDPLRIHAVLPMKHLVSSWMKAMRWLITR
ncbi:hypothetical protein B0T25DRAFT_7811 [Lasiosphaeria hispida]|uniref:Secreted protein n=1 Tax=Lasiosphaeria hispida TaxID=260671 RepID=A0AAJ0MJH7_9PEZI|nr:hypothetical protein B0T25DRAFT_7811 [Lasiosphaeria hispida]